MVFLDNNYQILQACTSLVASELLTAEEHRLLVDVEPLSPKKVGAIRKAISGGQDVLGDAYSRTNSPDVRRPLGQTYTPQSIVASMIDAAKGTRIPDRVVDVGCGSGRFAVACARLSECANHGGRRIAYGDAHVQGKCVRIGPGR